MMRVAGGINIFDDPTIKGKTIDPENNELYRSGVERV